VVAAGRSPVSDISRGELDVAELALCRRLPGQGEFDIVHVDAGYCPARATSRAMSPPPHPAVVPRFPAPDHVVGHRCDHKPGAFGQAGGRFTIGVSAGTDWR